MCSSLLDWLCSPQLFLIQVISLAAIRNMRKVSWLSRLLNSQFNSRVLFRVDLLWFVVQEFVEVPIGGGVEAEKHQKSGITNLFTLTHCWVSGSTDTSAALTFSRYAYVNLCTFTDTGHTSSSLLLLLPSQSFSAFLLWEHYVPIPGESSKCCLFCATIRLGHLVYRTSVIISV